jgi:peptidoglycan/LPS O-acetylase OafA/YrhL
MLPSTSVAGNNFNLLRLFAAFLVLYGHGHALHQVQLRTVLSHELGLFIFFCISGYLIAASWKNDANITRFLWRRSLRIFPGLIVVTVLSVFILGPLVTTLSIGEYFDHGMTFDYLKNITLKIYYELPGVFNSNPYPNSVNGSLWTLPLEFALYLSIMIFGMVYHNAKVTSLVVFISCILMSVSWNFFEFEALHFYRLDVKNLFIMGGYFWGGAVIYHWQLTRYFSTTSFAIVLFIGIFMRQWPSMYAPFLYFILPFLVICFGAMRSEKLEIFNRADYSYGLYIYAFPTQQTLIYLWPELTLMLSIMLTFVVTMILSVISWHVIEKPALSFKPKRV